MSSPAPDTGRTAEEMRALAAYEFETWVIPNGHGGLWTPRVFDSKSAAQAYIDRYWADAKWIMPKHRPIRARVQLIATPILNPNQEAGDHEPR